MAARCSLYFDRRQMKFISEEDAKAVVQQAVGEGNLGIMTDRFIEYGFPPSDDMPEIMKIKVSVENPQFSARVTTPASVVYLYYSRERGDFIGEDEARQLVLDAVRNGNLHLMTDRSHEYSFVAATPNLRDVRIVRICTIVG
ncbi:MAG: hypothetical protein G01um1014106_20 [Parcubacteria group bacterium Gr01-1014_106]|nr:MAG: hypothetical protein G01um1014106_20 [Parcubacteria group bacterium Gr01-1014_106]